MENFIDHMIFVCLCAAGMGILFGLPVFIIEVVLKKFDLQDKVYNFVAKLFSE